jgi:Holliday junction resolvase RusA-like endonuclease
MICLPLPPSLNNAFINSPRGRYSSPAYKAWQFLAAERLTLQSWDMPSPPYGVTIRVNINHKSDIDNRVKPVLDLLVKHGVLTGDQWVNAIHVYRDRTVDGCTVEFFDPDCVTIGEAANRVLSNLEVSE